MSKLLEQARSAAQIAQKKGASEVSAAAYLSRDVEIGWRDGKVEKVSEATTRGLSVSLYVDGRFSSVSTTDLRPEAVERFIEDSIALARTLAKDPHRRLPDPKRYEGRAKVDLQIHDPTLEGVSPEARKQMAREIEEAARQAPGHEHIVSVTTGVSDNFTESARVTSNGFEGSIARTVFYGSAEVVTKDGDKRPEDWYSAATRFRADMAPAAEIGRRAAERALATRGAKKIESAVLPLVVENRAAGRLLGALLGPLGGRALQQKQSFLEGQLGKPIASKVLTVVDDPHVPKGLGSRYWDGDGFAAKKMTVIEKGVLEMYFIDDYYGRKLGQEPTTGGASNLIIPHGTKDLDAIFADVKEAIFVTSFLGGNSNGTTGDFSLGVQGNRVRNGKRAEPIAEMNIAGNQRDFWKKLTLLGNDPYPYSAMRAPTLVFDGVQFAGA